MHDLPRADPVAPIPTGNGRHRRPVPPTTRRSRAKQAVTDLGSVVTLSALALLGVAVAAGVGDPAPLAESPTIIVTYDVGR